MYFAPNFEARPIYLHRRTLLQPLGVFGDAELFDEFADAAFHHGGQVVYPQADAVVGDAALGVVVGADFVGAVATTHHRSGASLC